MKKSDCLCTCAETNTQLSLQFILFCSICHLLFIRLVMAGFYQLNVQCSRVWSCFGRRGDTGITSRRHKCLFKSS